jgi:hypothetical protein
MAKLGLVWSIPKLPVAFPATVPPPPPPPGLPDPLSIEGSLGCVLGCGNSNDGKDASGSAKGSDDNDQSNDKKSDSNDEPTSKASSSGSQTSSSLSKTTSSASSTSCSSKAISMCTQKVELATSISGSNTNVQTKTTTEYSTVTAGSGDARTVITTTATATSQREPCSPSCSACMSDGDDDESPTTMSPELLKIAARSLIGPMDPPYHCDIDAFISGQTTTGAATRVPNRRIPTDNAPGTPSSAIIATFLN